MKIKDWDFQILLGINRRLTPPIFENLFFGFDLNFGHFRHGLNMVNIGREVLRDARAKMLCQY